MTETVKSYLTKLREMRIVRVVCGVCELCGIRYPNRLLALHCSIFGYIAIRDVLVVCPICAAQLCQNPVPPALTDEISRARSHRTWVRMLRAAGYAVMVYSPPLTTDLAPIFEEAVRGSAGTFRIGG